MRLEDGIVYWDERGRHKCGWFDTAEESEFSGAAAMLGSIADVLASLYTLNRVLEDLRAGRNCVP